MARLRCYYLLQKTSAAAHNGAGSPSGDAAVADGSAHDGAVCDTPPGGAVGEGENRSTDVIGDMGESTRSGGRRARQAGNGKAGKPGNAAGSRNQSQAGGEGRAIGRSLKGEVVVADQTDFGTAGPVSLKQHAGRISVSVLVQLHLNAGAGMAEQHAR